MTKHAYLIGLTTNPVEYGFGKHDGHVNACEEWESFSLGDVFEVHDWEGNVLGHGKVVSPVRANVIAFDWEPSPGSTFKVREGTSDNSGRYLTKLPTSEGATTADFGGINKERKPIEWKTFDRALHVAGKALPWGVVIEETLPSGMTRTHSKEKIARLSIERHPAFASFTPEARRTISTT